MRAYTYPAVAERGETCFGAFFPDLPGCVTVADSLPELAEMAREALQLHLEGMLEDGEPLPEPTPINKIPPDDEIEEVGAFLVTVTPGQADEVTIALSESALLKADEAAQAQGKTRAAVLSEQLERLLAAE